MLAIGIGILGAPGAPASRAWSADGAAAAGTPVGDEGSARASQVALEIAAADARDSDALAQVARELLGRLGLEVRASLVARIDLAAIVAPPPEDGGPDPVLARVWVDWRTPGRATLYLLDARRDRVLVRQVERPAGGEELAREELGHILETACEGLLSGGEVGEPRAGVAPRLLPPPRPPAAVAAVVPARATETGPARAQVALLYEAGAFAPEARLTHGPEVSLFIGLGAPGTRDWRWGLWSTAQLRLPERAEDESGAGVDVEVGALRAMFALERAWSERVTGRVGVGVGVDVVRARPEAATPDVAVLAPAFTRSFAVGRAAVAFDLRVARRTWLVVALAADVDVTGQRYTFARGGGGDEIVLRPWVVRPAAALGLAFP